MGTEDQGAEGQQGTENQQQGASNVDGKESSGTTSTAGDEFKAITSQAEFEKALSARLKREREKFADYSDLKTKATEFDKITEAQKTELQKIQDRAEAAEKRAAELEAAEQKRIADAEQAQQVADWKSQIAKDTGVPASALRGSTKEDLKAHAEELQALIPSARKGGGAYVPAEGRNPGGGPDPRQQFAEILKNA